MTPKYRFGISLLGQVSVVDPARFEANGQRHNDSSANYSIIKTGCLWEKELVIEVFVSFMMTIYGCDSMKPVVLVWHLFRNMTVRNNGFGIILMFCYLGGAMPCPQIIEYICIFWASDCYEWNKKPMDIFCICWTEDQCSTVASN